MGFFDTFTGKAQGKTLKKGYLDSKAMMQEGYDTGRGDIQDYYGKAQGYLDPYMESGGKTNALLGNALGVNGVDAQRQYMADFQNDPGYQAQFNSGINALDRSATARGGLYSGAAMKGVNEFGQQFQRQAFNDRINALSGYNQQGQQAAGAAAGMASQTGGQLGNMAFGFGQQQAANRINYANAKAGTQGMGIQNALNLAGTAAKVFAASDIRVKRDIERIGEMPSGLPVYRFRYLWSDEPQVGVMAQEAMQMFPDAVAEFSGILHVDYNAIG
jgi:hypothetical protein